MRAMCGGHRKIFSYASTAGTLQERSPVGQNGFVSISLQEGFRFGTREPLTICSSMGLFEILQGIAFGSSLYHFPWFGGTFETKER